ncbi:MAG: hypothetical protein A2Z25_23870 [Planctomycetes bacterium RBG_16_55_9]|nr:MAG: hypothetical protein A2Z25_23870 [Planctomycetes bacterium RBG_16_55_9]
MSFEEFKAHFQDSFGSQEELLKEYHLFLSIFEQLDQTTIPGLSCEDSAGIFQRAWQARPQRSSWILTWIDFFRQPAVAFALGIVIGCIVMSVATNDRLDLTPAVSAEPLLTVERTNYTQTYKGKMIEEFYPEFENPKIVLEKAGESSPPQRTLYGTLDNGEITVVWNL